jgi:hypothetical protein
VCLAGGSKADLPGGSDEAALPHLHPFMGGNDAVMVAAAAHDMDRAQESSSGVEVEDVDAAVRLVLGLPVRRRVLLPHGCARKRLRRRPTTEELHGGVGAAVAPGVRAR